MAWVSVRQDRVQDELRYVSGVCEGVVLGHVRSVRDAVDHHLLGTECLPEHVHVGDRVRSGIEAPVRADDLGAPAHRRTQATAPAMTLVRNSQIAKPPASWPTTPNRDGASCATPS